MKTLLIPAAFAAALLAPAAASAQALPPAVVAVVDLDRVTQQCTACKTAQTALHAQITAYQTREKSLAAPLETEQKSIQAAIDALKGKEPDAALQARAKTFQTRQQQAAQELQSQQQQIQRNQQYIQKQIQDKLNPIYTQVMQRRGATVLMEVSSTLATTQSVDVTNDVLVALNASLPSVATIAPTPPSQPQGR
jgi:outer membrane protein